MANNFLKYSELTYDKIVSQINTKLAGDSRFDNFRESAIGQTIVEIFAACADLVNYNLERRAEECYFDTAKLRSSVILLAKSLGYVITRPMPAQARMKVQITGNISAAGIETDDLLQIPIWSNFTYENENFLLKETLSYKFTSADVNNISADGDSFELNITSGVDDYIYLIQGERKTKIIDGDTNDQVGDKFQIYKIKDTTFSNKYGDADYETPITKVLVGPTSAAAIEYNIDRRSLINWESISNSQLGETNNICVIRTALDENVEILFGDATYSTLGASTSGSAPNTIYDNVYVEYLSTNGKSANKTGIINEELNSDITITVNGYDITDNVKYYFTSNLTGGADMESVDEIKYNAPNIYYSLDRLVTKNDYITYLKSLTSPINIKTAYAWGEQEEYQENNYEPIRKLFNVVMFSCLGSLYKLDSSPYDVRTNTNELIESLFDVNYRENEVNDQSYFNLYVKQNTVEQLKTYDTSASFYVLYGDDNTSFDVDSFVSSYSATPFFINLGSDYHSNLLTAYTSALYPVDISAATSEEDIATAFESAISAVTDIRGTNVTNDHYGLPAFSAMDVYWDTTNSRFIFSGSPNDPCNIETMIDGAGMLDEMGNLYGRSSTKITSASGKIISDDLNNLINTLDNRSMVTIRNIYVSPIIHNFNIKGNIYVKQLADKESLHVSIKDDIYTWLNTNVGFNSPIYLSNVIEIIENYPDVINADIEFEPIEYAGTTSAGTYFDPNYDSRFELSKYAGEKITLYSEFSDALTDYLTAGGSIDIDSKTITSASSVYSNSVFSKNITWLNHITEHSFFNDFVKTVYDNLDRYYEQPFRDSTEFVDVISDIHKDLSWIIKYNMLDTNGNITTEYMTQIINGINSNVKYKGGYTLGNEICKFNIATTIQYRTV